jgi:hypothetical protein
MTGWDSLRRGRKGCEARSVMARLLQRGTRPRHSKQRVHEEIVWSLRCLCISEGALTTPITWPVGRKIVFYFFPRSPAETVCFLFGFGTGRGFAQANVESNARD